MELCKATVKDYKTIKKLYYDSFPKNECAPFFFIKRKALQDKADMLVAKDKEELIGFAYTVNYKNLVYLFYLAVNKNKRGNGYGSEILRLLKNHFNGKDIFLSREPLDPNAKNKQERIKRHNFYLKNGFIDLPCQIKEAKVTYDVMSTNIKLTRNDYLSLIQSWAGKFITNIITMDLIEEKNQDD